MAAGYLLDTDHLSSAVRLGSAVRQRMRREKESGARFGTCVPVLCELEVGIQQVRAPDFYRKTLAHLLASVRIWPIDNATARLYGDVYHQLRRSGRVLSQVEMMLVALARQMKLTLLTSDHDFEALPDIARENWLDT